MHDTATDSARSRRRAGRTRLSVLCAALLTLYIFVIAVTPPQLRWVTAGLLVMGTITATIVVAIEISFRRAAVRAAESTAGLVYRRGTAERVSPLIQRAYYLARHDSPAKRIAAACDIPEAFAALIIDDVRRTGQRNDRPARRSRPPAEQ